MPVGPVSDLFLSMMISMHFGGSYYNIMVITDTVSISHCTGYMSLSYSTTIGFPVSLLYYKLVLFSRATSSLSLSLY